MWGQRATVGRGGGGRKGGKGGGRLSRGRLINPKAATEHNACETDKLRSKARRLADVTPAQR